MLYRPNYCCHCGESVERIEWKIWTSRRFCETCEAVFRKVDWLPRVGLGIAILFGLLGFGSYLKTPEKTLEISAYPAANRSVAVESRPNQPVSTKKPNETNERAGRTSANSASNKDTLTSTGGRQNENAAPVYFCGAQTKKGTPCTRKVRGGGRCWQHEGQPALLPQEKLLAGQ